MNQGTSLGSQLGRWIILAALVVALGALLLTIRPVGAQTTGCATSGSGDSKKVICNYTFAEHDTGQVARLPARELDQTQVVKVWEFVTNEIAFSDHRAFNIDRKTGVLTFKSPPDYENPRDGANDDDGSGAITPAPNLVGTPPVLGEGAANNVYKVKAKVGDGEKFLPVEVTVTITGIEEDGTITLSNRQPQVGVDLTATLADPDKGIRTPDWQWQVEDDTEATGWADIDEAVSTTYTPLAAHVGKKLRATAQYNDSQGTDYPMVEAVSEFPVRANPGSNDPPEFEEDEDGTEGGTRVATRRIEENTAPGMYVGPAVLATDDDHLAADDPDDPGGPRDVLTYTLHDISADATLGTVTVSVANAAGHAAMFAIDHKTGQIMTKAPLSYEGTNIFAVIVRAADPSGTTGDITVIIHVLDEDEAPQVMGPAALTYIENADSLVLDSDHTLAADETNPLNATVYTANDNDLDDETAVASTVIEWQITGPDAARFQFGTGTPSNYQISATAPAPTTFVEATGAPASVTSEQLQFRSAPNVEAPADKGGTPGDNIYEITLVAWDLDWEIGSRDVTIRVADSNDSGSVTLSHMNPEQGTAITATVSDPDDISRTVEWQWYTPGGVDGDGNPSGTAISGATSNTFTPPTTGDGSSGTLTVQATYTDNGATSESPTATTTGSVRAAPLGSNQAPKFYQDGFDLTTDDTHRIPQNEATTLERYVLENTTRNVTFTEPEARNYDDDTPTVSAVVNVYDTWDNTDDDTANPTDDTAQLQFSLSGADAKYFSIGNATSGTEVRGLIRTKGPLDFETKSTYRVTVAATDPGGMRDRVTVTINVLDQAEIDSAETRIRIPENTKEITDLSASYPPDPALGGLKWSLLTVNEPNPNPADTTEHNRTSELSVDCAYVANNDNRCANFRFERFNTANTTLRFAIGSSNAAPNYEAPVDVEGTGVTAPAVTTGLAQVAGDNVYQVRVRVAFANLRSDGADNHPTPQADEMAEETILVRVDDVDEAASFSDAASTQLITENTDDALPDIEINRDVTGTVTATDPEDSRTSDPLGDQRTGAKKLTYSLSLPEAYAKMFQIVPATGQILTRSRVDYEALDLEEQGNPGAQYKTITGATVTAMDSSGMDANAATVAVSIDVRDVNERPIPAKPLEIDGMTDPHPEGQEDTTAGTFTVSGDNAAMATWSLSGTDMDLFMLDAGDNARERVLKFKATPDFETPMGGADDDSNTYMVTIEVMYDDGEGNVDSVDMASMAVTVMVTNVEEMETVTLDSMYPSVGTAIMATLEDMDADMVDATTVVWSWTTDAAMDGAFTNEVHTETGAMTSSYTPVDGDATMYLRATATYTDGYGSDTAMYTAENAVAHVAITGGPEDGATVQYAENQAVTVAVATYTAESAEAVTWSVRGTDDSAFSISSDGVLSFNASPDHEAKSEYMVTVVAAAAGAEDSRNVTVDVTDADDPGMVTGLPATAMVGAELTAMVDDQDGATATGWQWTRSATMEGTYANITGANAASYTVGNADAGMYLKVSITYTDGFDSMSKTVVSADAVMVPADVVNTYDTDGEPGIQIGEMLTAIDDYFDNGLEIEDLLDVIDAYFNNG